MDANMTDRFHLEDQILKMGQIIDDLKEIKLSPAATLSDINKVNAIIQYYDQRFNTLWETFEKYIKDDMEKNKANIPADDIRRVTRLEVIDENGRSYTHMKVTNKAFSFQDEGRTLKIFLNSKGEAL